MNQARTTRLPGASRKARLAGVPGLISRIKRSAIKVPKASALAHAGHRLDNVDIEILEWIAAHGRGKRRGTGWLM